jgi:mono/diheme cytochrome c family protein
MGGSPVRRWKWIAAILAVGFLGVQFIRPVLPNPPVAADLQLPSEVRQILKTSCYNCHSNETRLSWCDKPVPGYWIVANYVKQGRRHLEVGAMPLPAYQRLHPESQVTPQQLAVRKNYLTSTVPNKVATAEDIRSADAEYEKCFFPNGRQSCREAPNEFAETC